MRDGVRREREKERKAVGRERKRDRGVMDMVKDVGWHQGLFACVSLLAAAGESRQHKDLKPHSFTHTFTSSSLSLRCPRRSAQLTSLGACCAIVSVLTALAT